MRVYVRKYDAQCISHQISVPKDIIRDFFDNSPDKTVLKFIGKKTGNVSDVTVLLATDPRLGGDIKSLISDEGGAVEGDLLVVYKNKTFYTLEVISASDPRYPLFFNMYVSSDRHLILNLDDGDGTEKVVLDKELIKKQFRQWMEAKKKEDGSNAFDLATVSNYSSGLNTIDSDFIPGLFEIYNYKSLTDSINALFEDTAFQNENKKSHNRLSCSLKTYRTFFEEFFGVSDETPSMASTDPLIKGYNKIFYGAPGCGKSRKVKDFLDNLGVSAKNRFRVTFHPEYSSFDFVGQIMPNVSEEETTDPSNPIKTVKNKTVEYSFVKGPFVLALERAFQEQIDGTDKMVYLIIEEINRGNAAAIFGDLFQLLDRDNSGMSEYPITNVNIIDRLKSDGYEAYTSKGVYIPNNLTVIATMNTSDQNVFTLDTAFKRRWEFEQVSNRFDISDANYYKKVPGTSLYWRDFVQTINSKITDPSRTGLSGEDKRIGKYFVKNDFLCDGDTELFTQTKDAAGNVLLSVPNTDIINKATSFAYKLLEYLWNDVAKFDEKAKWFDVSKNHTLEDLIESFVDEKENNPLKVFINVDKWN